MSDAGQDTRTVVVERELGHPPERIWRALTQPHLIQEWLMKSDFAAIVGHRFDFRADWGSVNCEVLAVDPGRTLAYRWAAHGLDSIVTWTLTPSAGGTVLRMEQAGFRTDQKQAFAGAKGGWRQFFARLEAVLDGID